VSHVVALAREDGLDTCLDEFLKLLAVGEARTVDVERLLMFVRGQECLSHLGGVVAKVELTLQTFAVVDKRKPQLGTYN
jgi:hypothetical protein